MGQKTSLFENPRDYTHLSAVQFFLAGVYTGKILLLAIRLVVSDSGSDGAKADQIQIKLSSYLLGIGAGVAAPIPFFIL